MRYVVPAIVRSEGTERIAGVTRAERPRNALTEQAFGPSVAEVHLAFRHRVQRPKLPSPESI